MLCIFVLLILSGLYSTLYWYLSNSLVLLPIWIILGILSGVLTFLIYVLILVWLTPFSKPDNKLKQKLIHPLVVFANMVFKIRLEVVGKENIPAETHVVYGNHKSMLDITILYEVYNEVITAVAKQDLLKVPLLRRFMRGLAVIPIDRDHDREGVKNMLKAIDNVKKGINYIIFPEGGVKSREVETMVALRPGAYKLAMKPKATISPISIIGSSKLSKNSPWHFTRVKVVIHKPIPYEEYKDYNTNELGLLVGTIVNEGVLTGNVNTKTLSEITPVEFVREEHEND